MKKNIIIISLLITIGLGYRLADLPANFSPLGAIALFSGFYFRRQYAVLVPLAVMLVSDFFLGFYELKIMLAVYLSFALIAGIGYLFKSSALRYRMTAAPLTGSLIFFAITNFAVWQFGIWYPHTLAGLAECFAMGLPFLKNTILGDLVFTGAIFGAYEAYSRIVAQNVGLARAKS